MEITKVKDHQQKAEKKQNGQSSNYKVTQRFIPPTHPAYVVTSNFTAPHILALQEEFDKNYIAMSMQTSKKKLSKIPDTPTDKFFIVTDDSAGPIILQGQFLTLNKKVINYPISNSIKNVIEQFNSYIGLGHKEVNEQRLENRYNMEENREARELEIQKARIQFEKNQENSGKSQNLHTVDQNALTFSPSQKFGGNTVTARSGFSAKSKIVFKEVSSRKEQMKISEGKLFVYDNRKDSTQYKTLVEEIKTKYGESKQIMVISRIDEYNYYCMKNKETSHIILMSHTAYLTLSQYFNSYHSFAVFGQRKQQMTYYHSQNIVIFTSESSVILGFIEKFLEKKQSLKKEKMKNITGNLKDFSKKNIGIEDKINKENEKLKMKQTMSEPMNEKNPYPQIKVAQGPKQFELGSPKKQQKINMISQTIELQGKLKPSNEKDNHRILNTQNDKFDSNIPKENEVCLSPKKSKITLLKITDFNKEDLTKKIVKQIPQKTSEAIKESKREIEPNKSILSPRIQPKKSKLEIENMNSSPQKSEGKLSIISSNKIKRLKSCRKFKDSKSQNQLKVQEAYQLPTNELNLDKPKLRPSVKTHLRTGSDHQNYMRLQKDIEPKRSFQEGSILPQGQVNSPSIHASESVKEPSEMCVKYPQRNHLSDSKKRCSISNREVNQAQDLRYQPTIQKLIDKSDSMDKKSQDSKKFFRTSLASPDISPDSSSKKRIFVSPISSKIVPLSEAAVSEESESDDNVMMRKKPKLCCEKKESVKQIEQKKQQQVEDDNEVFILKPCPKDTNEKQKNFLNVNVKAAEDRFDDDLLTINILKEEKAKKTLKKSENVPPQTKNIENSIEQSVDFKFTPNFNRQNLNNITQNDQQDENHSIKSKIIQNKVPNQASEKLFGDSEPSQIKNQNPLVIMNSPKKILEDENPRLSFGVIPTDLYSLQIKTKKEPENNDKKNGVLKTDQPIKEKESVIPLKTRKMTDKDKNQTTVNKIFKIPHGQLKEQQKSSELKQSQRIEQNKNSIKLIPQVSEPKHKNIQKYQQSKQNEKKVKEEDPYGLPLLKSKKKNIMKAAEDIFKQNQKSKKDEEKIGKIYNTLKTTSTQSKFITNDSKFSPLSIRNDYPRVNRVNSTYLPHRSFISKQESQFQKPRSMASPHSKSNENRQITNNFRDPTPVRTIRVRSIEDYIDLAKYDKVIQNGVTIYRAKEPIMSTVYKYPSSLPTDSKPDFYTNHLQSSKIPSHKVDQIYQLKENQQIQSPYSSTSPRQFSKKLTQLQPTFLVNSSPNYVDAMNEQVKALTYQICKNILTKKSSQPEFSSQNLPFKERPINKQEIVSPRNNKQQKPPLLNKMQAKIPKQVQSSQKSPTKIKNKSLVPAKVEQNKLRKALSGSKMQIPSKKRQQQKKPSKNLQSFSQQLSSSHSMEKSVDKKYESIVLYLINKNKQIDYPQIQLLKNDKDSLIYYKNQKQLAEQILKSENVYDLVYIITPILTPQLKKILKHYPNCYLVDFDSENSMIKNQHISVPSIEDLECITQKLVGELLEKRKKQLKVPTSPQPHYNRPVHKRAQKSELYQQPKLVHHCCYQKHLQHQCVHKIRCSECGQML